MRYKFRAECIEDVMRFFRALPLGELQNYIITPDQDAFKYGFPDVVVDMNCKNFGLKDLKKVLSKQADAHIMRKTISTKNRHHNPTANYFYSFVTYAIFNPKNIVKMDSKDIVVKIDIRDYFKLEDINSIRLFDLCKLWLAKAETKQTTKTCSAEDLKRKLGIDGKYKKFGFLKRFVIEPCVKEINTKIDTIEITYDLIKRDNNTTDICFRIEEAIATL